MVIGLPTQSEILIIPPNFPNLKNCNKLISKNIGSYFYFPNLNPPTAIL